MRKLVAFAVAASVVCASGAALCDEQGVAPRAQVDGRKIVGMMEWSAHGIAALLRNVRRTNDGRAIACVNESLSEADTLTRRAKDHLRELADATERGDTASEAHLLAILKEERAVQRDAANRALGCVGVTSAPKGKDVVTVSVTIDKTLPPEPRD
jgi:hypothetical protein